jgi:ABC-type nitrate/sulfonate/bicarbonate transport system substrate-binding protein
LRGGPTALAALILRRCRLASVGAPGAYSQPAKGLTSTSSRRNPTIRTTLLGSKEAKSVEDLRGKIIGVTGAGAFSDFAIRIYLKRNNLDPDKDERSYGRSGTALRAIALERGLIAAARFPAEDTIRLPTRVIR